MVSQRKLIFTFYTLLQYTEKYLVINKKKTKQVDILLDYIQRRTELMDQMPDDQRRTKNLFIQSINDTKKIIGQVQLPVNLEKDWKNVISLADKKYKINN